MAIIRDRRGNFRRGSATKVKAISSLEIEGIALREAMILAKNMEINNVIIESDCQPLMEALKSGGTLWKIDPILEDIQKLKIDIPLCDFTWIPREGNKVAHLIAELKGQEHLPQNRSYNYVPQLMNVL
ncbi:uncharacterized protein [Arachis hypogaea]|uniref:uncharacterized protein n=1 Tax=Arachis hypogaea TaxID=3818 RepID=UPI003B21A70A